MYDHFHIRVPREMKERGKLAARLASQEAGRTVTLSKLLRQLFEAEYRRLFDKYMRPSSEELLTTEKTALPSRDAG